MKEEVDSMIKDLQLTDKAGQRSAALSGGQKRKLRYDDLIILIMMIILIISLHNLYLQCWNSISG